MLMAYFHSDRIADIVGILLYYHTELVILKELVVLLFLCVFLYLKGDLSTDSILVALGHGISVNAFGIPLVCLLAAVSLCFYRYLRRYHKCRIEAYAELTDNIDIVLFGVVVVVLECF